MFFNPKFRKGFPDDIIEGAWLRSRGRCECKRKRCDHGKICDKRLNFHRRGCKDQMGWEAHHKVSLSAGGSNGIANCDILCCECYSKVKVVHIPKSYMKIK